MTSSWRHNDKTSKYPYIGDRKSLFCHYDVIFYPKHSKFCTRTFHMIVFAHTKFGLLRIQGSGVKRGGGGGGRIRPQVWASFSNPGPDRVKMKFLHLLWKFHGYIFNGLGEKWIWKLPPAILPVDLNGETRKYGTRATRRLQLRQTSMNILYIKCSLKGKWTVYRIKWECTCLSILLATFNYWARGTCGSSTLHFSLNRAANAWEIEFSSLPSLNITSLWPTCLLVRTG